MTENELKDLIVAFGEAPDSQIAASLAKECRDFDGDDPVRFLRDLRDKCVRYGGSSGFVVRTISLVLSDYPEETERQKAERRAQIEKAEAQIL